MTDRAELGIAAGALLDSGSQSYAGLDPGDLRDGIVELVAAQEAEYLEYEMIEIDIALVRVLRLDIDGVDERLVAWLAERPSTARLGVVCRALWQFWSPANPHPPIDPATVRSLTMSAAQVELTEYEIGSYRSVLGFAAQQVDDPGTLAAIDQELARLGH